MDIFEAVKKGRLDKVKTLLKLQDVNREFGCPGFVETLLSVAVGFKHLDIAVYLISMGADVNQRLSGGMTCLHIAVNGDDELMASLLLKNGANVNAKNSDGYTVLDRVRASNDVLRKLLIDNGAESTARS
jgi:ankyrin repeat protein